MRPVNTRRQLSVLASFLLVYAFLAFVTYAYFLDALTRFAGSSAPATDQPGWVLGLANAGIIVVVYGLAGLAGYWFARRLGLPGIYREGAGWRDLFLVPLFVGAAAGLVLVVGDRLFAAAIGFPGLPHPSFPFSLIASATAGIGEEIMFRGFVLGLWAFILNLLLRRWSLTGLALWIANGIAALAFGAGHLPTAMLLFGVGSPAELPPLLPAEIFVLNGVIGLAAGWRYMTSGLVAAIGIHFWADVVWHVIWPLLR